MTIQDRHTEQLRELVAGLPDMTDAELWDTQTAASEDFAAYTLHAKLPTERQGATDDFARRLRAQRAAAAEGLWLATEAELSRRRESAALAPSGQP